MAVKREDLGIEVNFIDEQVIQDIAIGNAVTQQEREVKDIEAPQQGLCITSEILDFWLIIV